MFADTDRFKNIGSYCVQTDIQWKQKMFFFKTLQVPQLLLLLE